MFGKMNVNLAQSRVRDGMVPSPVITTRTSVETALHMLRESCLPAVPVFDGAQYAGLVDEKSLLRLTPSEATTLDVWEMHDLLERLTVAAVVQYVQPVGPDDSLYDAARLMSRTSSQVLPVLEGGHTAGLLLWNALLAAVVDAPAEPAAC